MTAQPAPLLPRSRALPPCPPAVRLRPVRLRDERFLLRLYGTLRAPQLTLAPWTEAQKQDFVADQFALQQAQYRQTYPDADFWLVENAGGTAIGRLSLNRIGAEWRIIELLLRPEARGGGIGTHLVRWIQAAARSGGAGAVTLHVENGNRSGQRFYTRLGFADAPSAYPTHRLLRWDAAAESAAAG